MTARPWLLFFLALLRPWAVPNPAGSVPDEETHLHKALAAGRLELAGTYNLSPFTSEERRELVVQSSRAFHVPIRLGFATFGCNRFQPEVPATCLHSTGSGPGMRVVPSYVGSYPPFLYVL